jgi:hypothetical protein
MSNFMSNFLLLIVKSSASIDKTTSVIVEAGYLIRNVSVNGATLYIDGDLNATVPIKVIGAPPGTSDLYFNKQKLSFAIDPVTGDWSSTLHYNTPKFTLPDLSRLTWKYIDNLPEITTSYDDSAWTVANLKSSNNPFTLQTPTSLFGSDYGYNTGVLIYRGHFVATGQESIFELYTQGGTAYGTTVFLNSTYIGSWPGNAAQLAQNSSFNLPHLAPGKTYIFTILVDNNGLDENWTVGADDAKSPRGILGYSLSSREQSAIEWKLTGNLGGEKYIDKDRGPLNEGGLYAERQGFTLPDPPSHNWAVGNPEIGISTAGVAFYTTAFSLDFPHGYDIPVTFNFGNTTIDGQVANYRAQLWVNGYQFGKFTNHIGPQYSFPVPQGINDPTKAARSLVILI